MKKLCATLALIPVICVILTGCSLLDEDTTVSMSGDLSFYASLAKETLEGKYIEVTGTVDSVLSGIKTIYIGTLSKDNVRFSCDLLYSTDASNIHSNDIVTVRGKCSNTIGSTVYLKNCTVQITTSNPNQNPTQNTNQSDTGSTTETTGAPSHSHSFSAATCTTPKTCSCGATEGKAKGHTWAAATCTSPKTCTTCKVTEGSAKAHSWKNATYTAPKTCSSCGATSGTALQVPGKENYHGHVYTGGEYSKKFHYEANCAGANSHEITWDEVTRRGLDACGTCVLK